MAGAGAVVSVPRIGGWLLDGDKGGGDRKRRWWGQWQSFMIGTLEIFIAHRKHYFLHSC